MKIPRYLSHKNQVIFFQQDQVVNQSNLTIDGLKVYFTGKDVVYLYFEDFIHSNITLNFAENSEIKLFIILKSSIPSNYDFIYNLEKSAKLDVFTGIRNNDKIEVSFKRDISLASDAFVNIRNAILNMGKTNIQDMVYLNEVNAEVNIDVLNIGSYNDESFVTQDVFHNAKYTKSTITNSLISNANAKLKYLVSGRIFKGNEFSSCSQTNKGIILKENGEIEVEPKLYIDEYNVEASHGAAIGQIDDEQLYYLLSRGLTELESRSLIISGYTKPFIDSIEDEDIRLFIERQIYKKINEVDVR